MRVPRAVPMAATHDFSARHQPMSIKAPRAARRRIEISERMTLRDGEQGEGISMMPEEKLTIARRLLEGGRWTASSGLRAPRGRAGAAERESSTASP